MSGFIDNLRIEMGGRPATWLAYATGIKPRTIQNWFTRESDPKATEAVLVAKALGVTVEYLVTGTDSTDPWIRENRDLIANLKELNAEDLEEISAIVKIKADRQIARDLQSGLGS